MKLVIETKNSVWVWRGLSIQRLRGATLALFKRDPGLRWESALEKESNALETEGENDYSLKAYHEQGWINQGLSTGERVERILRNQADQKCEQ